MTEDNDGRFNLSRRKALAGIGSIGAATALGGVGTYAQFTDSEEAQVNFTAGGIDGTLTCNATYNGEGVETKDDDFVTLSTGENGEPVCTLNFEDVKPGDYGCFNWSIEVSNNPAWVASCIDIVSDTDGEAYEPESDIEDLDTFSAEGNASDYEVQANDYDPIPGFSENFNRSTTGEQAQEETDLYGAPGVGEMAENMLVLPYYDNNSSCTFFDSGGPTNALENISELVTPTQFWSNSQEGADFLYQSDPFTTQDGAEYFLSPRVIRGASNVSAVDTAHWKADESDTLEIENAPEGTTVGEDSGCVMLEGDVATGDSSSGNNTQGVSALEPGNTLNFGYDWHLPFGTGNEVQGDEMEVSFSFLFLQTRHTEAPNFGSYSPGSNTPS